MEVISLCHAYFFSVMPWKKNIFWFVNNSKYHHREMGLLSNIYMAAMHSTDFCMLVRHSFITVHSALSNHVLGGTFILSPLHQAYPSWAVAVTYLWNLKSPESWSNDSLNIFFLLLSFSFEDTMYSNKWNFNLTFVYPQK